MKHFDRQVKMAMVRRIPEKQGKKCAVRVEVEDGR
jgi:hypothetical protein